MLSDEFGLNLPDRPRSGSGTRSAEVRYWVLPQRPPGTEGMSEEELAALVTRDSMIGVGVVPVPKG